MKDWDRSNDLLEMIMKPCPLCEGQAALVELVGDGDASGAISPSTDRGKEIIKEMTHPFPAWICQCKDCHSSSGAFVQAAHAVSLWNDRHEET